MLLRTRGCYGAGAENKALGAVGMILVNRDAWGGWIEDDPTEMDLFALFFDFAGGDAVVKRRHSDGSYGYTNVVVRLTSSWQYIEPASGVEGGWKRVFVTA